MDIISPSRHLLEETRTSLLEVLPPGGGEIVRLLGISGYLECATVAARERAAGRLLVSEEAANRVVELVGALGVSCRRAPFRMLSVPSPVEGTDHCARLVGDDVAGARLILTLGISPAFAEGAEQAQIHRNHALLGRLFGYPACCVTAFTSSTTSALDRLPATFDSTGPFPFELNPILQYLYGMSFLFHFPCTPSCEASLGLLRSRRAFLAGLAPPAVAFGELGAGIALYGPEIGIGLITRFEALEPGVYRAFEVVTRSEQTRAAFSNPESSVVRLFGPKSFAIDGRRFDGPEQLAAVFA